jgi:4'-phosphopantetheinyl transferase EntD
VIHPLLPSPVAAVEIFGDDPSARLLPAEQTALGRVVAARQREFTQGRACAHRALSQLGLPSQPLLPGLDRAPVWPAGVVGSITHCRGYTAAAVAPRTRVLALGVDAEEDEPLPNGVLDLIATDVERRWLSETEGKGVAWDRVLFSAKESVFKVWYPLTHRWLGFEEAEVTIDPEQGIFRAHLLVEVPRLVDQTFAGFSGRYLRAEGLVLTAVTVVAT